MRAAPHIPTQGYFDYPPPPGGSVYEFYRLKALIILEQVNTSVVEKKGKKIWKVRLYVNFHCMQTSLVMIMRFIFSDDWNDALCWSSFDHVLPKMILKS